MDFIFQKDDKNEDFEIFILKNIMKKYKSLHSFSEMDINEIQESIYKNRIPVGTIEFVQAWLLKNYNIDKINPIEIPECLQTQEFLKRDYSIVTASELPDKGNYFIKDVSALKSFSNCGEISRIFNKDSFKLNPEHLYQISEIVPILSEYRVYIINGEIESVQNYDGNPLIFPDVNIIQKANIIWSFSPNYPKSATIDVMVTPKGTALIECHPFISVGLYSSLYGDNLLYAYRDGINYVLNHNNPVKTCKIK